MQLVIGVPTDKCQMHNLVRHKFCHSWFYRGINPQLILNKTKTVVTRQNVILL